MTAAELEKLKAKKAELDAQVKTAEDAAKVTESYLDAAKAFLEGRVFLRSWTSEQYKLATVDALYVKKVRCVDRSSYDNRLQAHLDGERMYCTVQQPVQMYPGCTLAVVRMTDERVPWPAEDFMRQVVREITVDEFKALKSANMATFEMFQARFGVDIPIAAPAVTIEYDFPTVQITEDVEDLFDASYMLPGNMYVVSRRSIQAAATKISEAEDRDARCALLYQSCDMKYVTWKRELRANARHMLEDMRAML